MKNKNDDFEASFEKFPKNKKIDLSYEKYDPSEERVIKKDLKNKTENKTSSPVRAERPIIKERPVKKVATSKRPVQRERKGFFTHVKDFFINAGPGEYLVMFTTGLLLFVAVFTFTRWDASKEIKDGVKSLIPVGEQIGEVAVHSDELVEMIIASFTGGQQANRVLASLDASVEISATFSSIMQDLKVKFINKNTDEMIIDIPFKVEIVPPTGEPFTVTDEDKDGMIYVRELDAGSYQVICKSIGNVKFSSVPVNVLVKDKLDYQEINIINEVKKESQINVAKEDTAIQEVVTESKLQDTVDFVASTKTSAGDGAGYVEVLKTTLTDPANVSFLRNAFYKVDGKKYTMSVPSVPAGSKDKWLGIDTTKPENVALSGQTISFAWTVDGKAAGANIQAQLPDDKLLVVGTTIIAECVITCESNPDLSGTSTATIVVAAPLPTESPTPPVASIILDKEAAAISRAETLQLKATVENASVVTWTSSDVKIITVDGAGLVTPVSVGKAIITATASEISATCEVTVKPLIITIKSSTGTTPETLKVGAKIDLTATFENIKMGDPITWEISKNEIGKITKKTETTSNQIYTFEALKEGTVEVTVFSSEGLGADKKQPVAKYQIVVKNNPQMDTVTKLKDNNGTQIYVKTITNEYREAAYADYYTSTKFYVKGGVEYTYTGWQTLSDNKTYFFDKKGNKVTGRQVIQGVEYQFSSVGVLSMGEGKVGIDVSKWNGNINWQAVKNSGIDFVIIRCGYRGSTTGSLIVDPKFEQNIKGATGVGLKVGVYFFTQAITEVEAVEEASMALALTSKYKLTYPIFIDSEGSGGRADGLDVATRTAVLKAFCQTVANAGQKAGIYASKNWYKDKLQASQLSAYTIWMAQYATKATYTGRYDIWQHSDKGHVGGIDGNVDMNRSYLNY